MSRTATPQDALLASKLFRGLGDATRLAILRELSSGEQRVTDLVARLQGTQGNISGHLACLKGCGLVADRREGRQSFYRIAAPEVVTVLRAAEDLLAITGYEVELCPGYEAAVEESVRG